MGVGTRDWADFVLTGVDQRSAWSETQVVLDLFWAVHPGRRIVVMRSLWPPDRRYESEPLENEMFEVNLVESIHKYGGRWLRRQPEGVVYFIWQSPVDVSSPPAPGEPPGELLEARAEIEEIRSRWPPE